jgi:integrase
MGMSRLNQYLYSKRGRRQYTRRVPSEVAHLDRRGTIRIGLKTASLDVARHRPYAMMLADDEYWAMLQRNALQGVSNNSLLSRYQAAKKRAMARGYIYTPVDILVDDASLGEILDRITTLKAQPKSVETIEAEAILGGVKETHMPVSQAFTLYTDTLCIGTLKGKSASQKKTWRKPKERAIDNFIALFGDLPMDQIMRKYGQDFYQWWGERVNPSNGSKGLNPNSANRDIGNMRTLFKSYWVYQGDHNRTNPFKGLNYTENYYKDIPAFENDWVRKKILVPGLFDGLNRDARLIIYALIETGCRPSEIANLRSGHIKLNANVPHVQIRPRENRQLKTNSAIRDIPLTGISLEAMRLAPTGFERYLNKGHLLSATLMKAFKNRNLFPSDNHRIYSFRHSFEKRMQESRIDYGLRCTLMGHSNSRPSYGDGGSLAYRQSEMLKFVHPHSEELVRGLK